MTQQALKASIHQLAIQGKLVPQRPEEGTAEDLYQQIQAEKQQLIANGTIKREKALSPIKEEEIPFDIPETWKWVRLGELAWFLDAGKSPKCEKKPVVGNEWGVITTTAIQENYFDQTQNKTLPQKFTFSPSIQVRSNDILITRAGPTNRTGVACLAREVTSNLILSDKTVRINMSYDYAHRLFIVFTLNSPPIRQQIIGKMSGMDKQQVNVSQDKMRELLIPLPPLEEQKRIVAKIEEMLPLIDRYGEAYTKLETFNKRFPDDLRKSILQEAIQGKLVPQLPEEGTAEELYQQIQAEKQRLIAVGTIKKEKPLPPIEEKAIPFDIPETWMWVRLGELFSFINGDRGKNYPAKSTLHKEGIPFISAINISDRSISRDGLLCVSPEQFANLRSGHLKRGDLVICIRGSLGKFCIYPYEQGAIASSLVILRQIWPGSQNFITVYLDSFFFREEIEKSQNGTAQPNLSAKDLAHFLVPLPPLEEQKRIVAKIEEMLTLCKSMQ